MSTQLDGLFYKLDGRLIFSEKKRSIVMQMKEINIFKIKGKSKVVDLSKLKTYKVIKKALKSVYFHVNKR